jgi:phosphocarrier protein HPr
MQRQVEIINKLGLHARPAALFVQSVVRFQSTIAIHKEGERYSAASILEVLSANLDCGARITLEALGPDEQQALDELEALLKRLPDEEGESA